MYTITFFSSCTLFPFPAFISSKWPSYTSCVTYGGKAKENFSTISVICQRVTYHVFVGFQPSRFITGNTHLHDVRGSSNKSVLHARCMVITVWQRIVRLSGCEKTINQRGNGGTIRSRIFTFWLWILCSPRPSLQMPRIILLVH